MKKWKKIEIKNFDSSLNWRGRESRQDQLKKDKRFRLTWSKAEIVNREELSTGYVNLYAAFVRFSLHFFNACIYISFIID